MIISFLQYTNHGNSLGNNCFVSLKNNNSNSIIFSIIFRHVYQILEISEDKK